ncbi:MAG TPA: alginate export family protein [Myxococcota bacterium]|nr:alginate export family protein [Myxococcota bacterium]
MSGELARRRLGAAAALTSLLISASASGQERPAQKDPRYEEDWSALSSDTATMSPDFFDGIKWISLGENAALSLGGQLRERVEVWDGFAFGAPTDDEETYFLTRIRVHSDLRIGENLRFFVEAKSAFSSDRDVFDGRKQVESDTFDLQNGFVEWKPPSFEGVDWKVRLGRQEMKFGKQRLVSPLEWGNARRTFDGGTIAATFGKSSLTAFALLPVRVRSYERNDHVTGDWFYGLHGTHTLDPKGLKLEGYFYGRERETPAGDERRHTVGVLAMTPLGTSGFDLETEGAYQFGHIGSADISAGMVSSVLGYAPPGVRFAPRVWIGGDWASGDHEVGGDSALFDQLFPLGHAYFGYIDLVGRQNVVAASTGITVKPLPPLTADLAFHYFRRAARGSGAFNAGGAQYRPPVVGTARELGEEIDFLTGYRFNAHLLINLGYSHIFPGKFIEQTGPSESVDFTYLQLLFTI